MSGSVSFERVAARYDQTRGGEERGRHLAREIAPLLDRTRPALEIGVGTGLVAAGLRELGQGVLGVDLSPAMAARAGARLGPRVAVGDALRLPARDGAAAQAYSVWVLHVVGDQAAALSEVARVLGPAGRYVVSPGHLGRPTDELGALLWELDRALDPTGRRVDDAGRLRALAPAAGLRVVEEKVCPPFRFEETPAEIATKLEQRVYSCLWDVEAAAWRRVVAPVVARLRAMPDPHGPRTRQHVCRLVVLERAR